MNIIPTNIVISVVFERRGRNEVDILKASFPSLLVEMRDSTSTSYNMYIYSLEPDVGSYNVVAGRQVTLWWCLVCSGLICSQ